ncbi:MAG: PAS domain-containing sensor histidine kinase [Candidatus Lokiarchaeota archaeon]
MNWHKLISKISNILFLIIDSKLHIEYANTIALQSMLGYESEEILKKTLVEFIYQKDKAKFFKFTRKNLRNGQGEFLVRVNNKSGKCVSVEISENIFKDKSGDWKILVTMRNRTNQRKMYPQIKNIKKSNQSAYKRMKFYKDLMSHDINNILSNLTLAVLDLKSFLNKTNFKNEEIYDKLRLMKEQIDKGIKLVRDIAKLSQLPKYQEKLSLVNITNVLAKSVKDIKKIYPTKRINICFNQKEPNILIYANGLLDTVFENILSNSIIHNVHQQIDISVLLQLRQKNHIKYVRVEFRDNGLGIPDSLKSKLFLSSTPKLESRGMGIGLTLVHRIIKRYNAFISIKDNLKGGEVKGTRIILYFPLLEYFDEIPGIKAIRNEDT